MKRFLKLAPNLISFLTKGISFDKKNSWNWTQIHEVIEIMRNVYRFELGYRLTGHCSSNILKHGHSWYCSLLNLSPLDSTSIRSCTSASHPLAATVEVIQAYPYWSWVLSIRDRDISVWATVHLAWSTCDSSRQHFVITLHHPITISGAQ